MNAVVLISCVVSGLAIGSFLNVVIYRVPRGLSVVSPPSACPQCHQPIRPVDNIPVLSWLMLRGRCRDCQFPISSRYPIVEATTALLFVGVFLRLGRSWTIPAYCLFLAGLLALALIDFEFHKLPKRTVWIHLALVAVALIFAAGVNSQWHHLLVGAICALAWSGLYLLINLVSPRLLGFGDVRLALVLGLALGYRGAGDAVLAFFLANVIGLAVSLTLIAMKRMTRHQEVPYGVFLAAGAVIALYLGPDLLTLFPNVHLP